MKDENTKDGRRMVKAEDKNFDNREVEPLATGIHTTQLIAFTNSFRHLSKVVSVTFDDFQHYYYYPPPHFGAS
jgi:hypothetical protein